MEQEIRANPSNAAAAVELAKVYVQLQQTGRAMQLLDGVLNSTSADAPSVVRAAMVYSEIGNWQKLEASLEKLVKLSPDSPEAWYDLAAMKANLRKDKEAFPALSRALALNAKRLQENPKAQNLLMAMSNDNRFAFIRQTPEFQKLVSTN
jgi:tetratricopeptide (TPR) repeat protein